MNQINLIYGPALQQCLFYYSPHYNYCIKVILYCRGQRFVSRSEENLYVLSYSCSCHRTTSNHRDNCLNLSWCSQSILSTSCLPEVQKHGAKKQEPFRLCLALERQNTVKKVQKHYKTIAVKFRNQQKAYSTNPGKHFKKQQKIK